MALAQKKKRFSLFGSPPRSPVLSPSAGTSFFASYFPSQDNSTERRPPAVVDDARKAVDVLERLVTAADTYRDLMNRLCKASKVFGNALKDYGSCKGIENKHVMCMQTTSQFYDCHADVLSKLNKALQKDFDLLQRFWEKYSKKVTKDERAHNGYVKDLDKQVKKIGKDYEKKSKKDPTVSLDSHNSYITSISTVGSEITRARVEYADQVVKREKKTHSVIVQVVCRLAEGHFSSFNDSLKKCGPSIAKMKEWAPFAGEDMPLPQGLDDFLEDQSTTPQSDRNSTSLEKVSDSFASISEKQLAAMNYPSTESSLPEPTLPIIDDNVPTKYAQMPNPKAINPVPANSFSPSMIITQKGSNAGTPVYPVLPVSPAKPSGTKSASDLLSGFSIGVHADDHPFFRDEKVVEVNAAELYTENRVEKVMSKPTMAKAKAENIGVRTSLEITENKQKEDGQMNSVENVPLVDDKPVQIKRYLLSETPPPKEFAISRKAVSDDSNSTMRSNNSTLRDDESNIDENLKIHGPHDTKSISSKSHDLNTLTEEINLMLSDVGKDSPQITDDRKSLISETPETVVKDLRVENPIKSAEQNISELKNEQPNVVELESKRPNTSEPQNDQSGIEKQNNTQPNKPLNKDDQETGVKHNDPINPDKELRTVPSISTNSLVESFPTELPVRSSPPQKAQQTIGDYPENDLDLNDRSYDRSPVQSPRPIRDGYREINPYERNLDDRREFSPTRREDYRELYRHDLMRYEDDRRYDDPNRYPKRGVVRHDYDYEYSVQQYEDRRRYDEPIRDPSFDPRYCQRRDSDGDYGPLHYGPPRILTTYGRDRSPPRRHDPYAYRSYPDPCRHGSSVADIRDRFQSMNEERRPLSSPRDFPIPRSGQVSDLTSRFGGMRNESRNDPHGASTLSRGGGDYQYNVGGNYRSQSSYRDERYIDNTRYGNSSLHSRHCDCYDCQQLNTSSPSNLGSPSPLRPYHNDLQRNS